MNTTLHDPTQRRGSSGSATLPPPGGSIVWLAQPASALVFTDLDGTLLDDSYDLDAAARAMDDLLRSRVMTIAVSSKTLREMRGLDALRERPAPFIFENGAGIAWPDSMIDDEIGERIHHHVGDHGIELNGPPYAALCNTLARLRARQRYDFHGFNDMDTDEVMALTGLDQPGAENARDRMCSEPLLWRGSDEDLESFRNDLAEMQLTLIAGGRFLHVLPATDKADAMASVTQAYEQLSGQRVPVLACGDSENDLAMLKQADACLTFPQQDGSYLDTGDTANLQVPAAGAEPWRIALQKLLSDLVPCNTSHTSPIEERPANE
ncbi:MAG: hypothetical protein NXH85_00390 [Pseudomonadaceae bacterium]|nr:hypothetical protein [Pseudomonadaceae bacterium]